MRRALSLAALAAAAAFPLVAQPLGWGFYVGFASRIMIYALAASSLNLVLGYGGMLSFGHAAFVGAGAYTAGILLTEGVASAWIGWPAAVGVAAGLAVAIGAISLRTRGVYFIMITLAFAQMMYYVAVGMKTYGGEEGLRLAARPSVGLGLDLKDDATFYWLVLAILAVTLYCMHRLARARFGGVVAVDDVSLTVERGALHALIGPNGAGKTTIIHQLSGALAPDAGRIVFEGRDLTRVPFHERVALGLARSYQITSIFRAFPVLDNVALAVQARSGSSLSFWRPLASETALFEEARAVLERVGLSARADVPAGALAHGEQRQLEVGLALATNRWRGGGRTSRSG